MATANDTCSVSECSERHYCRSYCRKHYSMWRRTGNPIRSCIDCGKDITGTRGGAKSCPECRVCTVNGCSKPRRTRKMCNMHAKRVDIHGTPHQKCPTCGEEMPVYNGSAIYCSEDCRPRCRVEKCDQPYYSSKGYCRRHAELVRNHGRPVGTREWTPRADEYTCLVCGTLFQSNGISRQFCHVNCQGLYNRYNGQVPSLDFNCGMCGEHIIHGKDGIWSRRDRLICSRCKSSSNARHGTSAGALALRDGNTCKLCGEEVDMTLRFPDRMAGTVDHILPVSRGGTHDPENLQLAHQSCNSKKQARMDFAP